MACDTAPLRRRCGAWREIDFKNEKTRKITKKKQGVRYGTTAAAVRRVAAAGRCCLLDASPETAANIRASAPQIKK